MFTVLGVALLRMLLLISGASSKVMSVASTWHSAEVVAASLSTETLAAPFKC